MRTYIGYFLGGEEQVLTLASVAILWLGLAGLGAMAAGREAPREGLALYGWGIVSLVFTAFGALTPVSFTALAWVTFLGGAAAIVLAIRRGDGLLPAGFIPALVLGTPLLLIASAMQASQWDEFSHWLPAVRHLLDTGRFPAVDNPVIAPLSYPAYPFNWPLLSYLASLLGGRFLEGAGRILNLLFLLSLGLLAARLALRAAGKEDKATGWAFAGLGLAGGTLLNPAFVQKVVLTAYADVSTATLTAFGAYLGWRLLEDLAEGGKGRAWAWRFALVATALINIKQVNLVLFALLVAGTGLAAWRDREIGMGRFPRTVPVMVALPIIAYLLWRFQVKVHMGPMGAEFSFLPFAKWNFPVVGAMLLTMLDYVAKKFAHFGLMFVAVGFALRALWRAPDEFGRLAIIVATVFLGYNAFLILTYLGSFGPKEAAGAISFWRYNMHVALLGIPFAGYGAGMLWRRHLAGKAVNRHLLLAPGAAVVVLALVLAPKYRFDHEPPKPRFLAAARFAEEVVPRNVGLYLLHPEGNIECQVITRARTNRANVPYLVWPRPTGVEDVRRFVGQIKEGEALIVHSAPPPTQEALGLALKHETSYFLVRRGGDWLIRRAWRADGSPE